MSSESGAAAPAVAIHNACLSFGERMLWSDFTIDVAPGEFIAVLGPNGSGKTSLLRALLGQYHLDSGSISVPGSIGYVPQQKPIEEGVALRGRDLVGFGVDGHRWGIGLTGHARRTAVTNDAIKQVDAQSFADAPLGLLSGGEQQRLRVAQALARDPVVLLCDEPLLSLDPSNQGRVASLIDRRRTAAHTAVIFVTHEINPILPYVDRVVYLVDGRFRIGTVNEVMTSQTLSELYRSPVEVARINNRLVVVGADDAACHPPHQGNDHS